MNKNQIINYLRDNEIEEIEEIKSENNILLLRVFYYYDDVEIEAAESYANEESEDEDEKEENFYIPYLMDIAEDNISEIIEEACDEFEVISQYVFYEVNSEEQRGEFIVGFSTEEFDIESLVEELEI